MFRELQTNYNSNIDNFEQNNQKILSLENQNNQLLQHLNEYQQKVFSYE